MCIRFAITTALFTCLLLATALLGRATAQTLFINQPRQADPYPIGAPTLTDLWVDPVNGNDSASGVDRTQALRTITAAWQRIPRGAPLTETGYRIQLVAGDYPESSFPEYWEDRHGTAQFPIILQAADGPRTARLLADLNLYNLRYLYLLDLHIQHTNDVLHCERCDHLLIRNSALIGSRAASHENVKINQSQFVYLEGNDIDGAEQNAVDFVAVQYGHLLHNRIHNADDWCIYLKGGSAHFRLEGNEIYDCGTGGLTAGEGSGFEYMVAPWLHYEAYDLKIINNVIHDTTGAGFGVNGGYNILFAYNTLYRVGQRSHLLEFVFGGRTCDGDQALAGRCAEHLAASGWGTTTVGADGQTIPNRNVYVYNNIIYNPPGYQSQWQHLTVAGPRPPAANSNIPSPAHTDDNLVLRGNVIWNGPTDHALGLGDESGCHPSNPTCNATQLAADNLINSLEPQLRNPAQGDFRPAVNSNLTGVTTYSLPTFPAWDSFTPVVAPGLLTNTAATDRNGITRPDSGLPGAYVADSVAATPTSTTRATSVATTNARLYLPAIANRSGGPMPTATMIIILPMKTPTPTASPSPTPTPTPTGTTSGALPAGPVTLVMLGDSLTAGQGDESATGGGYPRRLLTQVQTRRPGSTATNLGQSGWTSTDLIQGVNGAPPQLTTAVNTLNSSNGAKVALLWIGSNDLWYLYEFGNPSAADEAQDLQSFTANLDTILQQLRATGATVFVALLDDQSQRPVVANPPTPNEPAFPGISALERQRMAQQVIAYNNAITAKATQHDTRVVDFYQTTLFTTASTLADDGNHPNAAGYDAITTVWFGGLGALLQASQ